MIKYIVSFTSLETITSSPEVSFLRIERENNKYKCLKYVINPMLAELFDTREEAENVARNRGDGHTIHGIYIGK